MKKRCIRRHYALMNPITLAISGACKVSEIDLDKLRLRELSSIESFATNTATLNDFRNICDMLNLAETLALSGVGLEAMETCKEVQSALIEAKERYVETGNFGLPWIDLIALRELYAWHDAQRDVIDRSEYERAIQKTMNKIRSSHLRIWI